MTPLDEHTLYRTNHRAWCVYVAPRLILILGELPEARKRAAWSLLSDALKSEIRQVVETGKARKREANARANSDTAKPEIEKINRILGPKMAGRKPIPDCPQKDQL